MGGSTHAIVTSYNYTDILQVYIHPTGIQYPKYKSRHPKSVDPWVGVFDPPYEGDRFTLSPSPLPRWTAFRPSSQILEPQFSNLEAQSPSRPGPTKTSYPKRVSAQGSLWAAGAGWWVGFEDLSSGGQDWTRVRGWELWRPRIRLGFEDLSSGGLGLD